MIKQYAIMMQNSHNWDIIYLDIIYNRRKILVP